jgi:hypothetical protein
MRNCLILGSGRSGTSLMGGILKEAGYYMGENLYPARASNPRGFFENAEINGINELILAKHSNRYKVLEHIFNRSENTIYNPDYGQRWLGYIPRRRKIVFFDEEIEIRIMAAILKQPFAYKDPRFSYTLPVWSKFVDRETLFICVFREPDITVASILSECASARYLESFRINENQAYKVWNSIYSHIINKHLYKIGRGQFFFVHYRQLINGEVLGKLSAKLEAELNTNFVDKSLVRSKTQYNMVRIKSKKIYSQLCQLSGYNKEL